ncbi:DUF4252 domain-containing protein [Draconibacterium sp. IB214405]|uniref:DUF4252 domain-containing protein n=1 Tax=Draconibacterium sp. IB214405 TaxID=3097352 RepID=UPI002A0F3F42|nr:DUF4252 domain-containing protein [Draconibacterium sp. IB214405]MDX8341615.1 DUF4252 domain-containing protein [Draconibacterium sp. IB214405]
MKKLIVFVLMMGIIFPVLAQQSQSLFEELTEKFSDKDGFSASMLSSDMFDLYLKKKNIDENSELAEALKSLDNILVVSQSRFGLPVNELYGDDKPAKQEKSGVVELHEEILDHYKANGYSLLKTEKRMGEDVKVYLKKDGGKVAALALVTSSTSSTNLVEIDGDINLATVADLNKVLNLRGLENLYKIDNSRSNFISGADMFRAYNSFDEEQIAAMEARAREMAEQAKLSDEQIEKIEQQALKQFERQREMAERQREMAEKYGRQPIFLSTPGDTTTVYYIDGKKVKSDKVKELLRQNEVEKIEKTDEDGKTVIRIKTKKALE